MANTTTPGMHNHVFPPSAYHPPRVIEGLQIEDGSGHLPYHAQLAEYVKRTFRDKGRDAATELFERIDRNQAVNSEEFRKELAARGFL